VSVPNDADRLAPENLAAEEAELVSQIAAGDHGAPVEQLYGRYGKRLFRFGVQQLGNEGLAQELVQETFVRLWRSAGRFDAAKSSVGTYLYVIARSVAADIRKRPSSRPLMLVEDVDLPPIPDSVDQMVDSMTVREALDTLTHEQAEVIRLCHQEGLSQSQVAKRVGVPLGTVKTRSHHGMRALRSALIERGFHAV
jgi:RNA polymerase sigma-70 factor (ECF subfamily)